MANIKRFEDSLKEAADLIKSGQAVGVPTDTVYGLVCDACNFQAVRNLYALKKRPLEKPFQVVFSSLPRVGDFDLFLPSPLWELSQKFLPGALCPIALAGPNCPLATTEGSGNGKSQAVRVPNLPPLLKLASLCGPLACSSANISSFPPSQTAGQAALAFGGLVPLYLFSDQKPSLVPSTVVRALPASPMGVEILREGEISPEEIYRFLSGR